MSSRNFVGDVENGSIIRRPILDKMTKTYVIVKQGMWPAAFLIENGRIVLEPSEEVFPADYVEVLSPEEVRKFRHLPITIDGKVDTAKIFGG